MKTWLTIDDHGDIFRHNEYGDESELIGAIHWPSMSEFNPKWFSITGDNKTLSKDELKQILEWVEDWEYIL